MGEIVAARVHLCLGTACLAGNMSFVADLGIVDGVNVSLVVQCPYAGKTYKGSTVDNTGTTCFGTLDFQDAITFSLKFETRSASWRRVWEYNGAWEATESHAGLGVRVNLSQLRRY